MGLTYWLVFYMILFYYHFRLQFLFWSFGIISLLAKCLSSSGIGKRKSSMYFIYAFEMASSRYPVPGSTSFEFMQLLLHTPHSCCSRVLSFPLSLPGIYQYIQGHTGPALSPILPRSADSCCLSLRDLRSVGLQGTHRNSYPTLRSLTLPSTIVQPTT